MRKLIAMVATAVHIGGVRTIIQPGQELPELPEHDERELLQSGAAEHPQDKAALARIEAREAAKDAAEFEAARQKVLQARASTVATVASTEDAPADAGTDATAAPAKPAAKAGARK